MSRGQITTFIIVGVVILVVGVLIFSTRDNFVIEDQVETFPEVNSYVNGCLKDTVEEAVLYVGKQGGYYSTPPQYTYFFTNTIRIPVYYDQDVNTPSLEFIEESISSYIEDKWTDNCNLEIFKPLDLSYSDLKVTTIITDTKIAVDINFPIIIEKKSEVKDFSFDIPSKFKIMHEQATFLSIDFKENEALCLSCIVEIGEKHSLAFNDYGNLDTGTVTIQIVDDDNKINGEAQTFWFAYKEPVQELQEVWWNW